MKDYFKVIPAVHLFLVKDQKILLSRRFNTGFADGMYSVPAGHVEPSETATAAMIREAAEEIGITLVPEQLSLVHVMQRKSEQDRVDFFFVATEWTGEISNQEPDKCDDLSWFAWSELPENCIPYLRQALENYQNKKIFSEFGWN